MLTKPNPRRIDPAAEQDRHMNAGLKELAGRLQKLSYRDMIAFAQHLHTALVNELGTPNLTCGTSDIAQALLTVSDALAGKSPAMRDLGPNSD
jgi:hypothetical protein